MYGRRDARSIGDAFSNKSEEWIPERNTPSCFFSRPVQETKVAGYEPRTKLWFVYPVQNGAMNTNENDAIFYAGEYAFNPWDDLESIYADLKSKLTVLYGEPFYTGSDLNSVLGEFCLSENAKGFYEGDVQRIVPEYVVWKSQANGAFAVLSFWRDGDQNNLKLTYISNCAEEHFDGMAALGAFSEGFGNVANDGMEGL